MLLVTAVLLAQAPPADSSALSHARRRAVPIMTAVRVPQAPTLDGRLDDPAWQVRKGAATALGSASRDLAVPALRAALGDRHLDVRKAAARSVARWSTDTDVVTALRSALEDTDADVRAIARHALAAEA